MSPRTRVAAFRLVAFLGVTAAWPSLASAAEPDRPLRFVDDVVPILTKASCNSGGCHAKAGNGQNGFRLSLLGFEPREDFEHIVKEGHGRRVFPASPEQSLLLLKAANAVPHGGGQAARPGLRGLPDPRPVDRPGDGVRQGDRPQARGDRGPAEAERHEAPGSSSSSRCWPAISDGRSEDVTRMALYEPNDKGMAEVDDEGLVKIRDVPGNVAVMVRYQGHGVGLHRVGPPGRAGGVGPGREELHRRRSSSPT